MPRLTTSLVVILAFSSGSIAGAGKYAKERDVGNSWQRGTERLSKRERTKRSSLEESIWQTEVRSEVRRPGLGSEAARTGVMKSESNVMRAEKTTSKRVRGTRPYTLPVPKSPGSSSHWSTDPAHYPLQPTISHPPRQNASVSLSSPVPNQCKPVRKDIRSIFSTLPAKAFNPASAWSLAISQELFPKLTSSVNIVELGRSCSESKKAGP
jgi:hypothetical protein